MEMETDNERVGLVALSYVFWAVLVFATFLI